MSQLKLPDNVELTPVPAFTDNYIWTFFNASSCVVVDPGDAQPILDFCSQRNLILSAIIITHHHADHTGGIAKLCEEFPDIPVFGPNNSQIRGLTEHLGEGDSITIPALDLTFNVIEVPGHTLDHIAYIGHGGILCGDTLFSCGCGRLFEGTPAQMQQSLAKIMALPSNTQVWCTHEYTLANIDFALNVEPNNGDLQDYAQWARRQRANDLPTLPSSIGIQQRVNPFVRASSIEVKQTAEKNANQTLDDELAVFTAVRRWKDNY
ncbi:hydroxyacylglutathione hydrolase [Alteromonas sp. ASW11-36]|uniref:Hydroxyacylglutathione hydrolase n=1 Tax=Alteromonas arenosi TaxID=3055817 RepID=A0ABT7SW27_9ALTE|nr:hydroxyacylglutathione hydrolase [Alteromonas sp. ASW11-36]MDM7860355.1 hydroxyacylglutathione hydrolase [Alteromonas sp. ASW11-36]